MRIPTPIETSLYIVREDGFGKAYIHSRGWTDCVGVPMPGEVRDSPEIETTKPDRPSQMDDEMPVVIGKLVEV